MPIDFDEGRWDRIKETCRRWWADELDRPVVGVTLLGRDPGRPQPKAPILDQPVCHDFSISPEDLVDRLDYELSRNVFLGDAFPYVSMTGFGPGVAAAFLGANLDNSSGQVWFSPKERLPISEIHFEYDPDNIWLKRVKDICAAAMERWKGLVIVGMTDLGGNLDILSTFRPSEKLLLDLYDSPDEVKRLAWESHEAWHRFFNEINSVLQPVNPGYTSWGRIYSDRPCYMLQCDFCYMIGTEMFDEFVKPELAATCERLDRSFYHLDGIGQIPHLDSLLTIESLDGVQWVPGDGQPGGAHWPELYRRIHASGKKIQVMYGGFDAIDAIIEQIGSRRGLQHPGIEGTIDQEAEMRIQLEKYGIE